MALRRSPGARIILVAMLISVFPAVCSAVGPRWGPMGAVLRLAGGGRGILGALRSDKRKVGKHRAVQPTKDGRAPWKLQRQAQLAREPQAGQMAVCLELKLAEKRAPTTAARTAECWEYHWAAHSARCLVVPTAVSRAGE